MKRSKVKFEEVYAIENCVRAILEASKNKRKRRKVLECLSNIDWFAGQLSIEIQRGLPNISGGVLEERLEGIKKKKRIIAKPKFWPDQCVHWAFMLVLEPVLDKRVDKYSCSSMKGRGIHYAERKMKKLLKNSKATRMASTSDIHHCYPEIDKEEVIAELSRIFKDKRILECMAKIVRIYPLPGLPLGWRTSSPLANMHLARADRYLREELKVKRMAHYMDNYTLLHSNKKELHNIQRSFSLWLNENLHMSLNDDWQVFKMPYKKKGAPRITKERRRPIDAFGFKFYRYKTTIRGAIFVRIRRLIARIKKGAYNTHNAHSLMSRKGYFQHTDSKVISSKLLKGVCLNKIKEIIRNATIMYNTQLNAA